ncbi:MAG: ATP-binding protein [Chlorobia bacterium]|nr:ATP-binding protein [Fimbriimonadaceae bacterium]
MSLPKLIVVAGRPGSGKSTLATALAKECQLPLVSRDEMKEAFMGTDEAGTMTHGEITQRVYERFFSRLEHMLREGASLMAEAAFQHKVWAPRLEPLREQADIRLVICEVPAELAFDRRVERESLDPRRLAYHPHLPAGEEYIPPKLDVPTLIVDTSAGYHPSLEKIVEFLS